MPLRIKCPTGHTLIVPDDRAGQTLKCPRCDQSVIVPVGDADAAGKALLSVLAEGIPAANLAAGSLRVGAIETRQTSSLKSAADLRSPIEPPQPPRIEKPPRPMPVVNPPSPVPPAAFPAPIAELASEPHPESHPETDPPAPLPVAVEPPTVEQKAAEQKAAEPANDTQSPPEPQVNSQLPAPSSPVKEQVETATEPLPEPIASSPIAAPLEQLPQALPNSLAAPDGAEPDRAAADVFARDVAAPLALPESPATEETPSPIVESIECPPARSTDPTDASHEPEMAPPIVYEEPAPPPFVPAPAAPVTANLAADAARTLAAYQLAAALAAAALFSVVPAVWDVMEFLQTADTTFVARWALVLFFLAVVQLAYAVYLFQLPDWTTVWVVTLFSLALAAVYAAVLGLVLLSPPDGFLVGGAGLQLADKLAGGKAALWCLCMISLSTILAYFAGRLGTSWHRAEMMLRLAAA